MVRSLGLALLCALCASCAAPAASPDATAEELYRLINARLLLMRDVAAYKWHHELPIEDRARESTVLERSAADALARQLDPEAARTFFAAQIEAAKSVQAYWHERWQTLAPPPSAAVPDLGAEVRPLLLKLGSHILDALSQPGLRHSQAEWQRSLTVEGLGAAKRDGLFEALLDVRPATGRLARIGAAGVLRVGTTGDYAPFSHRADGELDYVGIDIDLGRDLGLALGVPVQFVPTSWPTLLADLAADRFDIAMSGVSVIPERRRVGEFSVVYYSGGKTAIARCDDAARFASLAAIDQPGVRVIVNPGGTNERFVNANVHRATVVRHPDNRTIFAELQARRADVMITDRIEVTVVTGERSDLCSTMPHNLNRQDKAYLLPQDDAWKRVVDGWLRARKLDGSVAAAFAMHGAPLLADPLPAQ